LDPIFIFSHKLFSSHLIAKTSGLVSKHTYKRTILGQLSFRSNLNERTFFQTQIRFPEKEKKEKEEIKVKLDPGEPNRPREESQPAAHFLQTRTGT
jgi:hypothetical protein